MSLLPGDQLGEGEAEYEGSIPWNAVDGALFAKHPWRLNIFADEKLEMDFCSYLAKRTTIPIIACCFSAIAIATSASKVVGSPFLTTLFLLVLGSFSCAAGAVLFIIVAMAQKACRTPREFHRNANMFFWVGIWVSSGLVIVSLATYGVIGYCFGEERSAKEKTCVKALHFDATVILAMVLTTFIFLPRFCVAPLFLLLCPAASLAGRFFTQPDDASMFVTRCLYLFSSALLLTVMSYFADNQRRSNFELLLFAQARRMALKELRSKQCNAVDSIMPRRAATQLIYGNPVVEVEPQMAVVGLSVAHFTKWCSAHASSDIVEMLNLLFSFYDQQAKRKRMTKGQTWGDVYIAGVPTHVKKRNLIYALEFAAFAVVKGSSIVASSSKTSAVSACVVAAVDVGITIGAIVGREMTFLLMGTPIATVLDLLRVHEDEQGVHYSPSCTAAREALSCQENSSPRLSIDSQAPAVLLSEDEVRDLTRKLTKSFSPSKPLCLGAAQDNVLALSISEEGNQENSPRNSEGSPMIPSKIIVEWKFWHLWPSFIREIDKEQYRQFLAEQPLGPSHTMMCLHMAVVSVTMLIIYWATNGSCEIVFALVFLNLALSVATGVIVWFDVLTQQWMFWFLKYIMVCVPILALYFASPPVRGGIVWLPLSLFALWLIPYPIGPWFVACLTDLLMVVIPSVCIDVVYRFEEQLSYSIMLGVLLAVVHIAHHLQNEARSRLLFLYKDAAAVDAWRIKDEDAAYRLLLELIFPPPISQLLATAIQFKKDILVNAADANEPTIFLQKEMKVDAFRGACFATACKELGIIFVKVEGLWECDVVLAMRSVSEIHFRIDSVLPKGEGLSKIKMLGDVLMIAADTPSVSVSDLFSAVGRLRSSLRSIEHSMCFTMSVGVGPVMGAILGTERLTFELFGDSVQTAYALVLATPSGAVAATAACISKLRLELEEEGGGESMEGSLRRMGIAASKPTVWRIKGRGSIEVCTISFIEPSGSVATTTAED